MAEGEISSENKENQVNNNSIEKDKNSAAYLEYEDFSHVGLGVETYHDGLQHPLELRKILIGDLSQEMSVTFREKDEASFKKLVHPKLGGQGVEIYDSSGHIISVFTNSLLPKPPKLFKGSNSLPPNPFAGGLWDCSQESVQQEEEDYQALLAQQLKEDDIQSLVNPRKPGRPPAQQGTFDPESGTIRYICRLECGASLASAKGRRKHEKKHCPNVPKEKFGNFPLFYPGNNMMGHSLFGGQRVPVKKQDWFECRICGKILKTYEGRRLHEKHQHKPRPSTDPQPVKPGTTQTQKGAEMVDEDAESGEVVDEDEVTVMDEVIIRNEEDDEDDDDDDEDEEEEAEERGIAHIV